MPLSFGSPLEQTVIKRMGLFNWIKQPGYSIFSPPSYLVEEDTTEQRLIRIERDIGVLNRQMAKIIEKLEQEE
jgi:hypothetical protein